MPQRRSFAPLPQNEAHVNAHGQHMTPPNLAPAPQPYAPAPATPTPPQPMPGAVSPVAAPGAQGMPRPPLPASIPLRPMSPVAGQGQPQPQPPMPSPQPRPGATISPANVDQFTSSSAQGSHGNSPDELAILKLLAQLGHTGDPNDANS